MDAHCAGVFKKRAAIVAQWVGTFIALQIWVELGLLLCDIMAPCDFFSTTHFYTVYTQAHVFRHSHRHTVLCCAVIQALVGSGGDGNRTCGSPLATWILTIHIYWVLCEQICLKCYNKHTLHTHTHFCVVFVSSWVERNPFETWNSSPSAAPVLPSTRSGAEQQQQENTGLCCLSRSPLDTFWTPSPNGRCSIEALLYWGACERTADLSVVSNVTRYCNKVSLRWQSWVCVFVCTYSYCMSQCRQA